MKIDVFKKNDFGCLTTITSEQTGITMFVAKEIAEIWGHTNHTQAIRRLCDNSEYKKIELSKYPEFKKQLQLNKLLTSSKANSIILLTESGMYKMVLASNLEKAKPFKDWVTKEVLPSIREKGYYSIADNTNKILIHTKRDVQLQSSKDVNKKHFIESGIESIIEYNIKSCKKHSGLEPKEIKEIGKRSGLKSKERSSAKEVLRHLKPAIACGMSFTDSLVSKGFDFNTVSELSIKSAIPLFQGMIELGIKPAELNE